MPTKRNKLFLYLGTSAVGLATPLVVCLDAKMKNIKNWITKNEPMSWMASLSHYET
nr:hypothetical protein [Mycoplasmopsis bovis]